MQRMWRSVTLSALTFFDGLLLGLGALDLAARGQALVAQNANLLDLRFLPAVFAERFPSFLVSSVPSCNGFSSFGLNMYTPLNRVG